MLRTNNFQRIDYIDIAKGFGIVLVIMGHTIFPDHFLIDYFHIPLFFILSGMTFSKTNNWKLFLVKKIDRILIPFVFFSLTSNLLAFFLKIETDGFNGPLWFLKTLFISTFFYYILDINFSMVKLNLIILSTLIIIWINFDIVRIYNLPSEIQRILVALFFIHFGRIVRFYLNDRIIIKSILPSLLIFISAYIICKMHFNIEGATYLNTRVFDFGFLLFLLGSLSGSVFFISISCKLGQNKTLSYLGFNSLIILCTHFPLIEFLNIKVTQLSLFNLWYGKIIILVCIYSIVLVSSICMIFISRKYLAFFTGYKGLIQKYKFFSY